MRTAWFVALGVIALTVAFARATEPQSDADWLSRWNSESARRKAERDDRVLEPCSREQWIAETTKPTEMTGLLRHKGWTKTLESYEAGGSDYFVIYVDSEFPCREFPRALNDKVRKQLLAMDGKYVRLKGRWAPRVRYTEEQAKEIAKDWSMSQRPMGYDAPPASWGGALIADSVEQIAAPTPPNVPDPREISVSGEGEEPFAAVRPAQARGVVQCEMTTGADGKPTKTASVIQLPDGNLIRLRDKHYGDLENYAHLDGKTVDVSGRWAAYFFVEPNPEVVKARGPVVKQPTASEPRALIGGGIVVDSMTEVVEVQPSKK